MVRLDLPEPYSVRFARESIKDSLRSHGEECILIHTYHVNDDYGIHPRCSVCYNEIYEQGAKYDCEKCYGTTFQNGIKALWRAWGIFTDAKDSEDFGKRGVWHPQERSLQTEFEPDLWNRDFVVRVGHWTKDHRVVDIEGIYVMGDVINESLRTGNQAGQISLDNVAQRCDIQRLSETMPIYRYKIIGEQFSRFDGHER